MAMMEIWQATSSFLTPATLFILLNLVIATIVLSSRHHQRHSVDHATTSFAAPLFRTTSPVVERLRSLTLNRFRSGEIPFFPSTTQTHSYSPSTLSDESGPDPTVGSTSRSLDDEFKATGSSHATISYSSPSPPLARTSSILDRLKSINLYRFRSGEIQTQQVEAENNTEYQHERSGSESSSTPGRVDVDVAKSEKKKKKMKKTSSIGGEESIRRRREPVVAEEEVDARADDFISKFKENLKIQRLNSIINYNDMLNRGR